MQSDTGNSENNLVASSSNNFDQTDLSINANNQPISISPKMVRPSLKAPPRKSNTGGGPRAKSRILTDTPVKIGFETVADLGVGS